ncbi:hypothetical protein CCP4SC76_6070006 [Gammaproteobacteria bacterium]
MTDELPTEVKILDMPRHVESWSAARIPGFVRAVLARWCRDRGVRLPDIFYMVLCPQTEINARGGLPEAVLEITDPRLRCRHFTGCHKPYFVVLFTDPQGDEHRAMIQRWLPWSEGYQVQVLPDGIQLVLREAVEDETAETLEGPALQRVLSTADLVSVLA